MKNTKNATDNISQVRFADLDFASDGTFGALRGGHVGRDSIMCKFWKQTGNHDGIAALQSCNGDDDVAAHDDDDANKLLHSAMRH